MGTTFLESPLAEESRQHLSAQSLNKNPATSSRIDSRGNDCAGCGDAEPHGAVSRQTENNADHVLCPAGSLSACLLFNSSLTFTPAFHHACLQIWKLRHRNSW